jgi:hypothetical protein
MICSFAEIINDRMWRTIELHELSNLLGLRSGMDYLELLIVSDLEDDSLSNSLSHFRRNTYEVFDGRCHVFALNALNKRFRKKSTQEGILIIVWFSAGSLD